MSLRTELGEPTRARDERFGGSARPGRGVKTPLAKATPQQRRVAEAWRRKASLKAAAAELRISYSTARNHIAQLCERTGARGSADIFFWLGVEEGLVSLRSDLVPGANADLR